MATSRNGHDEEKKLSKETKGCTYMVIYREHMLAPDNEQIN